MAAESRRYDHNSPLAPLVIDLISEGERAELEAAIDAPLVVERFERHRDRDRDSEDYNTITVGKVGGGRTFDTRRSELRAEFREQTENDSDATSDSGSDYYD
jgi:hypothetical protein